MARSGVYCAYLFRRKGDKKICRLDSRYIACYILFNSSIYFQKIINYYVYTERPKGANVRNKIDILDVNARAIIAFTSVVIALLLAYAIFLK